MDPLVKLKFSSSKRKLLDKSRGETPVPKKPIISSNLSAEQKFDALFGSTGSISTRPREPTPRTSPLVSPKKETIPRLKPAQLKKKSKLDMSSPFALAFGCVESDDDDESTFVADEKEDEMTAQDQWDNLMNETVKAAADEPPPKISSLRQLARNSDKDTILKNTENKAENMFDDAISLPAKPTSSTTNNSVKLKPPIKAKFAMGESKTSSLISINILDISPIKAEQSSKTEDKTYGIPPPELKATVKLASESKADPPGRPFREKRFFKSKKAVEYKDDVNDPYSMDNQFEEFKKPTLPKIGRPKKVQSAAEIRVPIADKMSDEQIADEGLMDDAKFYLEGVRAGSNDLSSRALTAISFAKRLSDEEFRLFLAKNKLPTSSKAHNLGQLIVLHLGDASVPTKTTSEFV